MPSLVTHRRRNQGKDPVLWWVAAISSLLSIISFAVVYRAGNVLTYNDSISHMQIARRVVSGVDTGLAQLGSVWLPLPHVLMLPLVGFDQLYYSGIAGAIVSMVAFVAACVFCYKIMQQFTGRKSAGIAAAVVFALNANVLYMQSTPMTEVLLFATLLGTVYYLQQWTSENRYTKLVGAAFFAMLATLTRYESWPILAVLALVAVWTAARERRVFTSKRARFGRVCDLMVVFSVLAFAGIVFWLIWNWVLFGSPLEFQSGDYAKPSLWVSVGEPSVGHLFVAAKTFWYATTDTVAWPMLIVAGLGLLLFVVREMIGDKLSGRSLVIPSLLIVVPFFVYALYAGQRPLHVMQVGGDLYNVRFGLIMIVPVALLSGYLVGSLRSVKVLGSVLLQVVVVLAAITTVVTLQSGVLTLKEPAHNLESSSMRSQETAATFLKNNYDHGLILVQTFGNERLVFSGVPTNVMVYEGTNHENRWERSLADPKHMDIRWVVMRCVKGGEDLTCKNLDGTPKLGSYQLVYQESDGSFYKIYRLG